MPTPTTTINIMGPWNVTCSTANSTGGNLVGCIPNVIIWNLPWWPAYILLIFYIALLIQFREDDTKGKYVLVTFLGMIMSWLMLMFSLFVTAGKLGIPDYTVPTVATSLFIATFSVAKATT
jgi:hypothetical protein